MDRHLISELISDINSFFLLVSAPLQSFSFQKYDNLVLENVNTWPHWFVLIFIITIVAGLEILSHIVPLLFSTFDVIPVKGKHLDQLEFIDKLFIGINKVLTIIFVYHVIQVVQYSTIISWKFEEITFLNTIGSLTCYYLLYDLLYSQFHRILHLRSIYSYVHKHHHRQKAPSRGSLDAMNVHPFEYIIGEYIHLVSIYFIPSHIVSVLVFILAGGILASLNHTRFDVNILSLYSVKVHDVHHRIPDSNYGQYIMFWDYLFGSYRPYNSVLNVKAE